MSEAKGTTHDEWARLRFSIVGSLLAAPPAAGELSAELARLAAKVWRHPVTGEPVHFAQSTIERWYYAARRERRDPVGVLRRRVRKDAGQARGVSLALAQAIRAQHRAHPAWSYRLHADNLRVLVEQHAELGPLPSYATIRRWMKAQGLLRARRRRRPATAGEVRAEVRVAAFETRSYEAEYVHALWHLDFHVGGRKVLVPQGRWLTPHLLGVLDDRSRLICHLQWYLAESAETLVHGLSQAIMKRGRPRALLTDNGSAMLAAETTQGLLALGIHHTTTLPYSPHQNGKQEVLWAQVEGRLLPMLEGVDDLTLDFLNESAQAWAELEYNRALHSELGCSPLECFLRARSVGLESPSAEALCRAFRARVIRIQRKSDGTVSLFGRRFEVPSRFRHIERLCLRCARWDLSSVDLVDERSAATLARLWPLDKTRNADGRRHRRGRAGDGRTDRQRRGPVAQGAAGPLRGHRAAARLSPSRRNRTARGAKLMDHKLLALFGLKYNPFLPDVPTDSLLATPGIDNFCWRIEHAHLRDGGFALVTGDPGTGKSVVLRLLASRLARLRDVTVGVITHPQSSLGDFYREIGELFGIATKPHNRWAGFKALRQCWQAYIESTLSRPVPLIDEAQEMSTPVLSELRLLSSMHFDSKIILSVVLAGDARLTDRFRHDDLLPLGSRIRTRLTLDYATPEELRACLKHLLANAGNAKLLTSALSATLADHAAGNYRTLMTMAGELLTVAAQRELSQLDEKLYLEVFAATQNPRPARALAAARRS